MSKLIHELMCIKNLIKNSSTKGILDRLNAGCDNPIKVEVCNQIDYTELLVEVSSKLDVLSNIEGKLVNVVDSLSKIEENTDEVEGLITEVNNSVRSVTDKLMVVKDSIERGNASIIDKLEEVKQVNEAIQRGVDRSVNLLGDLKENTDEVERQLNSIKDSVTEISSKLQQQTDLLKAEFDQSQEILTDISESNQRLVELLSGDCSNPIKVEVCNQVRPIDYTDLLTAINDKLNSLNEIKTSLTDLERLETEANELQRSTISKIDEVIISLQGIKTSIEIGDNRILDKLEEANRLISRNTALLGDIKSFSQTIAANTSNLERLLMVSIDHLRELIDINRVQVDIIRSEFDESQRLLLELIRLQTGTCDNPTMTQNKSFEDVVYEKKVILPTIVASNTEAKEFIDGVTSTITTPHSTDDMLVNLASDEDGNLYNIHRPTGDVYKFNRSISMWEEVGNIELPIEATSTINSSDVEGRLLYFKSYFFNRDGFNRIYTFNLNTGEINLIGEFTGDSTMLNVSDITVVNGEIFGNVKTTLGNILVRFNQKSKKLESISNISGKQITHIGDYKFVTVSTEGTFLYDLVKGEEIDISYTGLSLDGKGDLASYGAYQTVCNPIIRRGEYNCDTGEVDYSLFDFYTGEAYSLITGEYTNRCVEEEQSLIERLISTREVCFKGETLNVKEFFSKVEEKYITRYYNARGEMVHPNPEEVKVGACTEVDIKSLPFQKEVCFSDGSKGYKTIDGEGSISYIVSAPIKLEKGIQTDLTYVNEVKANVLDQPDFGYVDSLYYDLSGAGVSTGYYNRSDGFYIKPSSSGNYISFKAPETGKLYMSYNILSGTNYTARITVTSGVYQVTKGTDTDKEISFNVVKDEEIRIEQVVGWGFGLVITEMYVLKENIVSVEEVECNKPKHYTEQFACTNGGKINVRVEWDGLTPIRAIKSTPPFTEVPLSNLIEANSECNNVVLEELFAGFERNNLQRLIPGETRTWEITENGVLISTLVLDYTAEDTGMKSSWYKKVFDVINSLPNYNIEVCNDVLSTESGRCSMRMTYTGTGKDDVLSIKPLETDDYVFTNGVLNVYNETLTEILKSYCEC